jgi:hypothetical protein
LKGVGNGGVIALYAGALEPAIAAVDSEGAVASYMAIARARTHSGIVDALVPGVLKDFDLPDVAGLIAPRPLHIASARAATGAVLESTEIQREYEFAVKSYERMKKSDALEFGTASAR